ncbi:MAG: helicase C-terminal domain-containing protein [Desulfuromonadales bacterium]
MDSSLSPDVCSLIRSAVVEASGNEVFFLGRTNDDQCVCDLEILARGHKSAAPAILQTCSWGDVVIHNHPTADLTPSDADLEIASRLGSLGVGFFIVDNDATQLYRVVEPFAARDTVTVKPERINELLGPDGAVAANLPGFEERPEQLRMSFSAAEAFNTGKLATIEAGTGTGKSLAYLVPAILWAIENEERVVVSTNTINLQEQLIRKDIPFLQRASGLEFRAELVKGRGNYLCLRRLEGARKEPGLFEDEQSGELSAIAEWAETTVDGSREDLSFLPHSQVWEEVRSEVDQCGRVRCAHYNRCFFHRARRRAARARVLVVNHALLLSDLAVRAQSANYSAVAVLPPFERIILDEAHHLEDVATSYFAATVTRFAFARTLNRLRHPRKVTRGLLPRLLSGLAKELPDSADALYRNLHGRIESLTSRRQSLLDEAVATLERTGEDLAAAIGETIAEGREIKHRVRPDFTTGDTWQAICDRLKGLARQTDEVAGDLIALLKAAEALPERAAEKLSSPLLDLRAVAGRLQVLSADLFYFTAAEEEACAWFEVSQGRIGRGTGIVTRLCTAPLDVAESLDKALYQRFKTVLMTSATLTVDNRFTYFKERVGLNRAEPERVLELQLHSPFDYENQALLAVPTDVPEPNRPGYPEMVRDLSEQAILAADGRTFVLFTAYSLLRRVHGEIAPVLTARGFHCLRQGEANRHRLLKSFADDPTSVLFATDSFWEGVDVPGRALEQVIIARLPFKVPTEPVLQARAEEIEARGGDPFMEYTVPQAVIRFRQGFGRLIRHKRDRGVVLILDSRVVKKGYGRIFLRSLPEARLVAAPAKEIIGEIAQFCNPPS